MKQRDVVAVLIGAALICIVGIGVARLGTTTPYAATLSPSNAPALDRHTSQGPQGYSHVAVPDERQASEIVGSWGPDDANMYHDGLKRLQAHHRRLSSFTIRQVVDNERKSQVRELLAENKADADAAGPTPTPPATPRPSIADGDPSCLKLMSQHGDADDVSTHVRGDVINTCNHDFQYVEITFQIENSNGAVTGDALANVLHIDANQTWSFDAIGSSASGPWTFRMTQLTGH